MLPDQRKAATVEIQHFCANFEKMFAFLFEFWGLIISPAHNKAQWHLSQKFWF